MTTCSGEQRRLASLERRLDSQRLQVQPPLQVVDFSSSCAPTLALVGFCLVFA